MGIISKMRKQDATYWPRTGTDRFGQPTYGTAVAMKVRWEDSIEAFIAADGSEQKSIAKVYVGQDTPPGGVLVLTALADVAYPADPLRNPGAWEIKRFDKLPNLRNTELLRTAYL